MNDSVISSRLSRVSLRWSGQPRIRFHSRLSGVVAASIASRISGCRRVCSCNPISRLASTICSADRFCS